MTLIIGVSYKDKFSLVSTDSKVTVQEHDAYSFERYEGVQDSDLKGSKIERLTDNVFYVHAGIRETSIEVGKELRKKVNAGDDLEKCSNVLQEVTDHLYFNKRQHYYETGAEDKAALSLNFIGTEHFTCYLFGFFENGVTGLAYINPDTIEVKMIESPIERGFQAVIISPSRKDNDDYLNWIGIPETEQNFENLAQQMYLIHAKLSHKHDYCVSSDFNLHVLKKEDSGVRYYNNKLDTSELYPMFEDNPEIDYTKVYKMYKS